MQILYSLRVNPSLFQSRSKSNQVSLSIDELETPLFQIEFSSFENAQKQELEVERSVQFQAMAASKPRSPLKGGQWVSLFALEEYLCTLY